MENILFVDSNTPIKVEIEATSPNTIQIITNSPVNTSGFQLVTDTGDVYGEYEDYTTLYKELDDGFILSNDGSTYVEPEPIPVPEPYEPTLEEIKEQKIAEMNFEQQRVIKAGINVTLSEGITEHFTLKDQDQISLMGLQTLAAQGTEKIPWHESNNAEHCKYYSAEDMNKITSAALSFISFQVTYFRDLRIYINSMQDKESIQEVEYGMYIPEEYQSEVLADFYSAHNNA